MSLLKFGAEAIKFIAPLAESAGKILITGGLIVGGIKAVQVTGRGIGKGLDGVRHIVGYEDNLFSEEQPTARAPARKKRKAVKKGNVKSPAKRKAVKKGNVKTSSGNRSAAQLAGDKKRKATAKKKKAAKNVGEKSVKV